MKKITKLTEADLSRIVKRVIKEDIQNNDLHLSITLKDIFREVKDVLDDLGGYDESMREKVMDLSKEIMGRLENDLSMVLANYLTENYEDYLYEILGDEDQY